MCAMNVLCLALAQLVTSPQEGWVPGFFNSPHPDSASAPQCGRMAVMTAGLVQVTLIGSEGVISSTMALSKWLILIMVCYRAVAESIFLNFKP